MSAHKFTCGSGVGVVNLADIYRYKGFTFEFHPYCGPFLLKKDMEPRKIQPMSQNHKFWTVLDAWEKLSKKQKEETRIYG